ncbi:Membrane-bound lytic murein transglycosylase D precursor [Enhygromyxa salina]|uniref:Membrane-bound lytic murein transglycosylase D n=1 Tax=Enhygromyxa salina TaxID=215803 RepID=A0A0C2DHW6_9BACT|nr:Membrane-bound lytic murein transglycosylase D precursor [Enhygromyxa salina]
MFAGVWLPLTVSAPASASEPLPASTKDAREAGEASEAKATWIKHRIIPGERLGDIATRYKVSTDSLIRWNKLDPKDPKIFAGRSLRVLTKHAPPPQQKLEYIVKSGDTWNRIAKAHNVDPDLLRLRWNPKVPKAFKAGQKLVIWVEPAVKQPKPAGPAGETAANDAALAPLPLVKIRTGSISVGTPSNGKLINALQLPENKQLYTLRRPDEAYGSSHTLDNLQLAIARWRRDSGFTGALKIGAISKQGGGKLKPHSSHRSGRDVDIRLPVVARGGSAEQISDVDWDALWGLVMALVDTGEVQTIYLTTDRQKHLLAAAKRAGADQATIEHVLQYPEKSGHNNGIVRNQSGHTAHIHVRFNCAPNETRCEDK